MHLKSKIVLPLSAAPELSEFMCHVSIPHELLLRVTENVKSELSGNEAQEVAVELGILAAIQENMFHSQKKVSP